MPTEGPGIHPGGVWTGTWLARFADMKPFVVLYATREGQTRRIAEHVAELLAARGHAAKLRDVRDIGEQREPFEMGLYRGAILAASVHTGKHEPEMIAFVKRHRAELDAMPTAFLSVSLAAAGAADTEHSPVARAKAARDCWSVVEKLVAETGWRPGRVEHVAGALAYSKYNFLVRFVMKRIAKSESMPTDTSRDYEMTDWKALDLFVDELLGETLAPGMSPGVQSVAPSPPTRAG